MAEFLYKELTEALIGAAMEVHKILGGGFLESVYQNALAHELRLRKIPFEEQVRMAVYYKGTMMGEFIADFVIDGKVIVEIKALSGLSSAHIAQTLHYLAATGNKVGMLLNFGGKSLEYRRLVK
jgi:GxxExxY protein